MHSKEFIASGGSYKVRASNGTETEIITPAGVLADAALQAKNTLPVVGGTLYPIVSPKATVEANTADATLAAANFGKIQTNTGASGTIVLTLPAASTVAGKAIKVALTVAQIVRVKPATGEKVYLTGSGVASKYLNIAGVIGNYVDIYCDGTDFLVVGGDGVLTKEA